MGTGVWRFLLLALVALAGGASADVPETNGNETNTSSADVPGTMLHVRQTGCFPRMYKGMASVWTFVLTRLLQHNGRAMMIAETSGPGYKLTPELAKELEVWAAANRNSSHPFQLDHVPVTRHDVVQLAQLDWEQVWMGLVPHRMTSSSHTESSVRALQFVLKVKLGLPVVVDGVYKNATLHALIQALERSNGLTPGNVGDVSPKLWRTILQADCALERSKSPASTPQDGYVPGAGVVSGEDRPPVCDSPSVSALMCTATLLLSHFTLSHTVRHIRNHGYVCHLWR